MKEVIIGTRERKVGTALLTRLHHNTPEMQALMVALRPSMEQKSRAYETTVQFSGITFVVTTGTKEIHLRLGKMGENARIALMRLIDAETATEAKFILSYQQENGSWRGYLCDVQRSRESIILITMSPSN